MEIQSNIPFINFASNFIKQRRNSKNSIGFCGFSLLFSFDVMTPVIISITIIIIRHSFIRSLIFHSVFLQNILLLYYFCIQAKIIQQRIQIFVQTICQNSVQYACTYVRIRVHMLLIICLVNNDIMRKKWSAFPCKVRTNCRRSLSSFGPNRLHDAHRQNENAEECL